MDWNRYNIRPFRRIVRRDGVGGDSGGLRGGGVSEVGGVRLAVMDPVEGCVMQ